MIKTIALAAALTGIITPFAFAAETLAPAHAETVDLGATQGSAYYVAAPDGYHVIATLMPAGGTNAVRFAAVLTDGQSATVSIPGPVGTPPQAMVFTRTADHLVVRRSSDARSIATQ